MQPVVIQTPKRKKKLEPAWEIASLFPHQGQWSVQEYLDLPTNRQVEYIDGYLEVLPLPSLLHQRIILFIAQKLLALEKIGLGITVVAAFSIRLWEGRHREPDIAFIMTEHKDRIHDDYWDGADLVIEVVSSSNRNHDLITKRKEYAQAGIPEYWIVNPEKRTISVLILQGEKYAVHGVFGEGQTAASVLLSGFEVNVSEVWAVL